MQIFFIKVYQKCFFLPKGGEGYVWAEIFLLLHIALKHNALKENVIAERWLISFIDVFGFWIHAPVA